MPLLKELPIAELDLTLIASYCQLYAHWRQLNNDINKNGQVIVYTNKDGEETSRKLNPAFNAMMNVQKELRAVCGQLGMTVNSRMQLVIPEENDEEDEFLKVLRGG
jgi:P27 family predicted phage terminase small subunit